MTKILVIVVGLIVAYWLLKRYQKNLARRDEPSAPGGSEDMVRCVKCGLHLPKSESVEVGAHYYCSPEHAREGARRGQ